MDRSAALDEPVETSQGVSIAEFLRAMLRRPWVLALASVALLAVVVWLDYSFGYLVAGGLLCALVVSVLGVEADRSLLGMRTSSAIQNGAAQFIALAVMAIFIAHLEKRLQEAGTRATLDPLTGVLNRTEMQARVEKAIRSARAGGPGLAFAYVDCDRFKEVNDTRGHAFGDQVLRELAARLQSAVQDRGIVGRMGGDEFVALFEGISEQAACGRMEAAELCFALQMKSLGCDTTMTFGLVQVGAEPVTFRSLIEAADSHMYARKPNAPLAVVATSERITPIVR